MAAVAFDSLHYAHQLEAAGMPRAQAEVIAQGLTSMFVHNFDSLVTKDYLDARLDGIGARLDSMDAKFDAKLDLLSEKFDAKVDLLSEKFDARLDLLPEKFDANLGLLSAEIDGKLGKLYVMLGVIMTGVAVPIIQSSISWLAQ
jgi:hypothetical protein